MRKLYLALMLGTLQACGGGSSPPMTPSTPVPTPTPVTYNGTYTGTSMTLTSDAGVLTATASTTITQTGSNLSFTNLQVTSPVSVAFGMGSATLTNNTFDGTNTYQSSGCGIVTNHYRGYFSGDGGIMNLTMTLTHDCGTSDIRGEMRR